MNTMFKMAPSDFDVEKSYNQFGAAFGAELQRKDSFGGYSVEYLNHFTKNNRLDQLKKHLVQKAGMGSINTQTGGAGTAGTALIPVYVDPTIVNRTIRETPLRNLYPRRAIRGQTYDFIPLTAKGGAVWAAENEAIADQVDTYDRESVNVKYLYAKGRVSGPSIASMRGFIDPTQLDLSVKTASMMEAEEDAIINGDASTNPLEPNGLIVTITTNTTDLSSGLPTLAQIRAEFATSYNNNGIINLAVTDAVTHNYIKGLLQDIQRIVKNPSEGMLGFGIPDAFEFDGVMFIKNKFMPRTANAKRILFLDMRYLFMAVLQDMTYEEKASELDSYVYLLKEYITPVNTFEGAMTQMYGIA